MAQRLLEINPREPDALRIFAIHAFTQDGTLDDAVQKLDNYANNALIHCLGTQDSATVLISEENDEPITFERETEANKYAIFFDPLDGSSNIDVNVNVGTIFSIYRIGQNVEEIAERLT